ncbi:MAG: hypothetical protein K8R28_08675 [Desulfobacterales bacterium]|nr:hypothetical protein [Desulfobacterales bacterium]
MKNYYHEFHIPVMGTGHSVDTPIRVACLGITSVISLVDDLLLEKIRKYYSEKFSLPYSRIPANENDGRAKRTTAYLETVHEIVHIKMDRIKKQPFFKNNEKGKYFDLLPEESPLKKAYNELLNMKEGSKRSALEKELTSKMRPGSIDVNLMVKVDRTNYDSNGAPLSDEFSDAKTGLRGYAESSLESAIVFSAGINQRLFNYMTRFRDFYRDKTGQIKKRIILKRSYKVNSWPKEAWKFMNSALSQGSIAVVMLLLQMEFCCRQRLRKLKKNVQNWQMNFYRL